MRTPLLTLCLALIAPATAAAGPQLEPRFLQTDRTGATTTTGVSFGLVSLPDDSEGSYHADLFGQWMVLRALGIYGNVTANALTTEANDDSALGNAELGGVWVPDGAPWPVVARIGMTLPTAPSGDVPAQFANNTGQMARFTDAALGQGEVTWARAAVSTFLRDGQGYFRVDVGVDVALFGDRTDEVSHLLRVNAAAGLKSDKVALSAELITNVGLEDPGQNDRFLHVLSVGGRYLAAGDIQPNLAILLPMDDELRDLFGHAFVLGIEYVRP